MHQQSHPYQQKAIVLGWTISHVGLTLIWVVVSLRQTESRETISVFTGFLIAGLIAGLMGRRREDPVTILGMIGTAVAATSTLYLLSQLESWIKIAGLLLGFALTFLHFGLTWWQRRSHPQT